MIGNVRKPNPNRVINWIVIAVRWGFLIAAAGWLYFSIGFTFPVLVFLGIETLVNLLAMGLAGLSYRTRSERLGMVAADCLFAYAIFYLTLPVDGNLQWLGLLPVISAAFYFQLTGALSLTLLTAIVQAWMLARQKSVVEFIIPLTIMMVLYLVFGALAALAVPSLSKGPVAAKKKRSASQIDGSEHERQRTIFKMISALSSTLNYERVLESALDMGTNTLMQLGTTAERMRSAALLFSEVERNVTELQVNTSRGLLAQDARTALPGAEGLLGKAIESGDAGFSKDISQDPELTRFVGLRDCRSAYCIPLRSGLDTYGILLFAHPDPEFFTDNTIEILDVVGNQSNIALQNARLYRDLAQEKERMTEIQEESRKKLARDLHDGPTQSVAAIAMRVNFARRLMERDSKAAAEELFKIEELARRTTKEIRHMLFTLRPLVLESQGLVVALQSMAEKTKETYGQLVIIQAEQRVVDAMEMGKQAVVFYIAEEAVTNARKHAQAPHIWVRLKMLREELSLLEIEDDGVGFNVNQVDASYENRGSLGMVNMRERTELVNGVLRIDSTPGRGTRINVIIPLSEEAADRLRRGM